MAANDALDVFKIHLGRHPSKRRARVRSRENRAETWWSPARARRSPPESMPGE